MTDLLPRADLSTVITSARVQYTVEGDEIHRDFLQEPGWRTRKDSGGGWYTRREDYKRVYNQETTSIIFEMKESTVLETPNAG